MMPKNNQRIGKWFLGFLSAVLLAVTGASASLAVSVPSSSTFENATLYPAAKIPATYFSVMASSCVGETFCMFAGKDTGESLEIAYGNPENFASMKQVHFSVQVYHVDIDCRATNWCALVTSNGQSSSFISGDPDTFTSSSMTTLNIFLHSITCPTQITCIAIGDNNETDDAAYLAGDPTTWTSSSVKIAQPLDNTFGFSDLYVRCPNIGSCTLAGLVQKGMTKKTLFWSGSYKTFASSKVGAFANQVWGDLVYNIYDLWCFAADSCIAKAGVGVFDDRSVVLKGSPGKWNTYEVLGGHSGLSGMACVSYTKCSAGIEVNKGGKNYQYLYNLSDPVTWAKVKPTDVTKSLGGGVIACTTANCYAFGEAPDKSLKMLTGAAGNYSKATIQSTIENYGYRNQIFVNSLDCITETSCVAVGTITKNRSNYSFSSVFDPTRWDQAILNTFSEKIDFAGEGNPPLSTLRSVSCVSQTFCVAVGSDADVKPQFAVGNPAKWKLKTLPKFKYMSSLRYVTCVSTTYCVAVGQANEIFVEQTKLIVFAGDPNTWDDTKATVVQFPDLYEPSGVSCVAAKDCVLTLYAMNNSSQGNVYKGDPAKLTVASVKHFGTNGYLNKLSCFTKTNCVAIGVGTSGRPPKKGQPLGNYSTSLRLQTGNPAQWNLSNVTDLNAISSGSAATAELGLRGTAVFSSDNWIHNRYYGYLDMDCRTSNECYAIGLLDVSGSTYISAFDPASSAVVSAVEQSLPSKFKNANLEVVSCTPTQCYAMGNSDKGPFIVNISGQAPIN